MRNLLRQNLFIFILGISIASFAQNQTKIRLNDNWQFLKEDLGSAWEAVRPIVKPGNPECQPIWENITLPHCVNAFDGVVPDVNYYQGPAWYRTQLELKN